MSVLERWLSPKEDRLALEVRDGVSLSRSGIRPLEYSEEAEEMVALLEVRVGDRCDSSGVRGEELLEDEDGENVMAGAVSRRGGISRLSEGITGLRSSGPSEYSEGESYSDDCEDAVAGKLARGGVSSSGDCASTAGCHTCSSGKARGASTIGANISPKSVKSSCVARLTTLLRRIISNAGRVDMFKRGGAVARSTGEGGMDGTSVRTAGAGTLRFLCKNRGCFVGDVSAGRVCAVLGTGRSGGCIGLPCS